MLPTPHPGARPAGITGWTAPGTEARAGAAAEALDPHPHRPCSLQITLPFKVRGQAGSLGSLRASALVGNAFLPLYQPHWGDKLSPVTLLGLVPSNCPLLQTPQPLKCLALSNYSKCGKMSEFSSSVSNPSPKRGLGRPARGLRMGGQLMRVKGASSSPLPFPRSSPPTPTAGPAVLQLPEAPTVDVALLGLGPERQAG